MHELFKTVRLIRNRLHARQLSYYAAACERMYGAPPREVLIYSLPLGDGVPVDLTARGHKR